MEVNPTTPVLTTATPTVGARLYPAFSLVRRRFSGAVLVQRAADQRADAAWHGLNMLASYTLSHAVDDVSGLNIGGESRPILPVTIGNQASIDAALAREKGDALFDARHPFRHELRLRAAGPDFPQRPTRLTLGGWQVNGIIQGQTGSRSRRSSRITFRSRR